MIPAKDRLYETDGDFLVRMTFDLQNDIGFSVYTDDSGHDTIFICDHDSLLKIEDNLIDSDKIGLIKSRCLPLDIKSSSE